MRLLVLGGTWFLGRVIAERAIADGWSVTTFRRGTRDDVPGVQAVRGDRSNPLDFSRLAAHGPWDAVIDTIAFVPSEVLAGATILAPFVGHYVLTSTVNAYSGWPDEPLSEQSPRYSCPANATGSFAAERGEMVQYGTLKAGCERAVREVLGKDRATILRPGVVLGPNEYVGRLPWWLQRASRGGKMLAPGPADQPIQPIDVRDLAQFALLCAGERLAGEFNATAPIGHAAFGDLVDRCVTVTGAGAEPVWVDPSWLIHEGVKQWTELPLWRTRAGVWQVDSSRARTAGLRCRPLSGTVDDTWEWLTNGGKAVQEETGEAARSGEHGMSAQREANLLSRWLERL